MYFVAAMFVCMTIFLVIYEELEPKKNAQTEEKADVGGVPRKDYRTPPCLQNYPALNT